jgi:sec-independent protein translocase protein TatC
MALFRNPDSENPEAEMGFFDHVEILRWHIIRSIIAIVIGASAIGVYYDFVFDKIILGVRLHTFPTYRLLCWISEHLNAGKGLCITEDVPLDLQNTTLFGQIGMLFEYCLIFGVVLAFPYIVWEVWRFVAPALSEKESKKAGRIILACSFFFFLGVVFCYFVIIPFSVSFAVSFTVSEAIENRITVDSFIDFFTMMLLIMGIVFELPMLVYFLSKLGILGPAVMRKNRRYAVVIILIVSGIITPSPDLFTQCIVAVPIYLLYEFSIVIAARNARQRLTEETIIK